MKNTRVLLIGLLFILSMLLTACKEDKLEPSFKSMGDVNHPDLVVIGSELEGMYLARAAKDEGMTVVVLDPRDHPGGQLIQGEMLYLDVTTDDKGQSLVQGKAKPLFEGFAKGTIRKKQEHEQYFNQLVEGIPIESGIKISHVDIVTDESGTKQIRSITYLTKDGNEKTLDSKLWVENTDFAALSSRLGLTRIPGIETVFGDPAVPEYMAASMMMKFKGIDWDKFQREVNRLSKKEINLTYGLNTHVNHYSTWGFGEVGASYTSTQGPELFLRGLNTVNQRDGEALINALLLYNVNPADEESVNRALEMGKREAEPILLHLRDKLPGWENAELNGFPNYLYIRDYDRYETEYVLQATDVLGARMFWDNVSIAGYAIDLQGTINAPWGDSKGKPDKYGMPLRSFLAKGYSNVVFAGKNVGASAVAYGSARIQANTAIAGEVIGILAARTADKGGLTKITEQQMKEHQNYIKNKYNITLRGVKGVNKIDGMSTEEMERLNRGR